MIVVAVGVTPTSWKVAAGDESMNKFGKDMGKIFPLIYLNDKLFKCHYFSRKNTDI